MKRRDLIKGVACSASAWPLTAHAQRNERVRRIVILSANPESDLREQGQLAVFRDGLRKLGWTDGQNIRIEMLWRAASVERATAYVAGLVQNPPEIVVAGTLQVFLAMRREAGAIPMVFTNLPDPVVMGFVTNLARPDGNFTGFTAYEFATAGKWVQVLKELAPHVSRVAMVFAKSTQPVGENFYRAMQAAAGSLGVETVAIRIDGAADVQAGIDAFALEPDGGLLMAADPSSFHRSLVNDLALRHRLPAVYPYRQIIDEGGLAFYGIDFDDQYRGAATYVDRILRGTRPADLPIQAPTKFELGINLKAAKTLGLTVPAPLLARADRVIE